MINTIPIEWFASLEDVAKKLNMELSLRKLISFKGVELIRDLNRNIVYELSVDWVGDDNPQREIINGFWHEDPFFTVTSSTKQLGEIIWAREKPYGIDRNRGIAFEYGDIRYGAKILTMLGEFPNLKFQTEKIICWGRGHT
jgi:hypothetical protein